jgi:hypothetical protein
MPVAVKEEEFRISKVLIDPKKDEYLVVNLVKGLDISEKSYRRIVDELGGLISETPSVGGMGVRVVGGKSNGKSFVGVFISEEGYYSGMRKDKHISKNDPDATHVLIRLAVPPEPIRKEIAEKLGKA